MVWLRAHVFWILVGIAFVWIHTAVHERRGNQPESSANAERDGPWRHRE